MKVQRLLSQMLSGALAGSRIRGHGSGHVQAVAKGLMRVPMLSGDLRQPGGLARPACATNWNPATIWQGFGALPGSDTAPEHGALDAQVLDHPPVSYRRAYKNSAAGLLATRLEAGFMRTCAKSPKRYVELAAM